MRLLLKLEINKPVSYRVICHSIKLGNSVQRFPSLIVLFLLVQKLGRLREIFLNEEGDYNCHKKKGELNSKSVVRDVFVVYHKVNFDDGFKIHVSDDASFLPECEVHVLHQKVETSDVSSWKSGSQANHEQVSQPDRIRDHHTSL